MFFYFALISRYDTIFGTFYTSFENKNTYFDGDFRTGFSGIFLFFRELFYFFKNSSTYFQISKFFEIKSKFVLKTLPIFPRFSKKKSPNMTDKWNNSDEIILQSKQYKKLGYVILTEDRWMWNRDSVMCLQNLCSIEENPLATMRMNFMFSFHSWKEPSTE